MLRAVVSSLLLLWLPLALLAVLDPAGMQVSGARILAVMPLPAPSHFHVVQPLLRALAARGHAVTVISHFPQQVPTANYTDISLRPTTNQDHVPPPFLPPKDGTILSSMMVWRGLTQKMGDICRQAYAAPDVRRLLASDARFDLVLAEVFAGDCMAGMARRFGAPLVGYASSAALPWVYDRMGNPDHPAYMENFFLPMVAPLGFWERLANSVFYLLSRLSNWWLPQREIDDVERAALGSGSTPTTQLVYNTSLVLFNSHFSLNEPVPLVPSMVEVGGMHIQQPGPLPEDLQEFFDSSEHGVVYFSMGTLLRFDDLPQEQLQGLLRAFESLPQRVLWNADPRLLPPLPSNVRASAWLPQNDVLNHPKTVAFITHGGLLGVQEAVSAGVPMLVVPQIEDQLHNAASLSRRGVALTLRVPQLTAHSLRDALDRLVNDTSYRKHMKELSLIFRDRPRPPLEEAVYWVEYVIRHQGAPHLRSAALDLAWYQLLLLDVIGLTLTSVLLALASICAGLRWILAPLLAGTPTQRNKVKSN